MKFVSAILILLIAIGCERPDQKTKSVPTNASRAAVASNDISITIELPPRLTAGNPVLATIIVKNARAIPIHYSHIAGHDFRFRLIASDGKSAGVRSAGAQLVVGAGSVIQKELAAGSELKREYDLQKLFVLDQPGTYLFTVIFDVHELDRQLKPADLNVVDVPVVIHAKL